ncbi:hypothetical protein L873DRAFT_1807802 [Choiromyces venosus 120613-1]|uniref:Uncharacterized protein n=1 Tax=Choiromyces venosus 120613-1 TaxID=1336337 RepID=A0A3N4JP37_9PEZI|nr:hypothetical protein L873DRAFT_1807802 [Choiromyces venosus 120613-1]
MPAHGSGRAVVEGAEHMLQVVETWEALPQAIMNRKYQLFHEKLQRVILCAGNNNFNG